MTHQSDISVPGTMQYASRPANQPIHLGEVMSTTKGVQFVTLPSGGVTALASARGQEYVQRRFPLHGPYRRAGES